MSGETRVLGTHRMTTDGDVVHLTWVGELTPDDTIAFIDEIFRVIQAQGRGFALIDLREASKIGPEARKQSLRNPEREASITGVACYGASFATKVLLTMVHSAMNAVRKVKQPLMFAKDEAEARAWIDARRREVLGGAL